MYTDLEITIAKKLINVPVGKKDWVHFCKVIRLTDVVWKVEELSNPSIPASNSEVDIGAATNEIYNDVLRACA